jgi:hypothetical protein
MIDSALSFLVSILAMVNVGLPKEEPKPSGRSVV